VAGTDFFLTSLSGTVVLSCNFRFFSMCLPRGQETELAGFYVYCTQILSWLPPLLFTVLIEANVAYKYGVILTSFGFVVSIGFLSCAAPWPEIVKEAEEGGSALEEAPHNELSGEANVGWGSSSGHYAEFGQVEQTPIVIDDAPATTNSEPTK
jgi:hypothetical protein